MVAAFSGADIYAVRQAMRRRRRHRSGQHARRFDTPRARLVEGVRTARRPLPTAGAHPRAAQLRDRISERVPGGQG
jgi:hypothetical protein